jgi:tRNA-splicing ligase RtcB
MKTRELANLGIPKGPAMRAARRVLEGLSQQGRSASSQLRAKVRDVVQRPAHYADDPTWKTLADALLLRRGPSGQQEASGPQVPWAQFGSDLDPQAVEQLRAASRLPVAVRGALMPDAHKGYGLPIGGVLATDNAVIPYAVGMDIACRMKLTVLDLPPGAITGQRDRLAKTLQAETRFGVGAGFDKGRRRGHPVMDEDWSVSPVTRANKDKAWAQLGSSGSGNHFAEFGLLTLETPALGLQAGQYLALLTHSGSRGVGGQVAQHYSKLAGDLRRDLPRELSRLAWLDLDSAEGREYWQAMELMGRYAAANHQLIHEHIRRHLGAEVLLDVENHHNFAWKETHAGRQVVVHRKGATPAHRGAIGIIPGSMASPGYVVEGTGCDRALRSASHGAGRAMSRKESKRRFTWSQARKLLAEREVHLLSAGLDEVPMAYKDIDEVMAAQKDLIRVVARFDPRIVKMAGD